MRKGTPDDNAVIHAIQERYCKGGLCARKKARVRQAEGGALKEVVPRGGVRPRRLLPLLGASRSSNERRRVE